jgi:hypothetical protein
VSNSDISGNPIEPDAPATITAVFEDGTRRRLEVTSAEAETYRGRGTNETKWWHRLWAFVRSNAKKIVFGAVALVVASLAIPAATKQWSDRQEALALKGDLVAIADASTETYAEALAIPVRGREQGKRSALNLQRRLTTEWTGKEAVVYARLKTYFDDNLSDQWIDYQLAMRRWIALGCCGPAHDGDRVAVRVYLDEHPPSETWRRDYDLGPWAWRVLKCAPHDEDAVCRKSGLSPKGHRDFDESYIISGQALNGSLERLVQRIRESDVKGFSTDWRDFIDDLNPLSD